MNSRTTSRGPLTGLALALAAVLAAPPAEAYCRTSTCEDGRPGQRCEPPESGDCGVPLFWNRRCIGVGVQEDASAKVDWETAHTVATASFVAWRTADCGGGRSPSFEVVDLGPIQCRAAEFNTEGGNANVILFHDESWPYGGPSTLAMTTVTYRLDTGEIYDADLEINATAGMALTTGEDDVVYDLQSIITHEAGHMLGLAHSPVDEATMNASYTPGDTSQRSPAEDDVAAICAVYPPLEVDSRTCDATPRGGFKSTCGPWPPPEEDDGCTASGRPGLGSSWPAWLGLLGLARWARRRCS